MSQRNRPVSRAARAAFAAAACLLAGVSLAAASGCAGDRTLLESDVPLPLGMETVRSADIKRAAGTVTGGRFLLAGEVRDASDTLRTTIARFEAEGWRVETREAGLDLSSARFAKNGRVVTLSIARRALDPDMSTAMLEISSAVR